MEDIVVDHGLCQTPKTVGGVKLGPEMVGEMVQEHGHFVVGRTRYVDRVGRRARGHVVVDEADNDAPVPKVTL